MSELFCGYCEVGLAMSTYTGAEANYLPRFVRSPSFLRYQTLVNIGINADYPLCLSMKSVNDSLPRGIIPITQHNVMRVLAHIAAFNTGHELGVARCRPELSIT